MVDHLYAAPRGNPIFCALDTASLKTAQSWASRLSGLVGGIKLGLEFFSAEGPEGFRALSQLEVPLFLDVKLHDIPNTVSRSVRALAALNPAFMTLHASGGTAMMAAAVNAARADGARAPRLLAVTVLTSLDDAALADLGFARKLTEQVVHLARLAQSAGVDGVVCSALEIRAVREACGPDFFIAVPGLRPASGAVHDQQRIATPQWAKHEGADMLIIGRPITEAQDPAAAARAIAQSVGVAGA